MLTICVVRRGCTALGESCAVSRPNSFVWLTVHFQLPSRPAPQQIPLRVQSTQKSSKKEDKSCRTTICVPKRYHSCSAAPIGVHRVNALRELLTHPFLLLVFGRAPFYSASPSFGRLPSDASRRSVDSELPQRPLPSRRNNLTLNEPSFQP
jgi:hypothetical protein